MSDPIPPEQPEERRPTTGAQWKSVALAWDNRARRRPELATSEIRALHAEVDALLAAEDEHPPTGIAFAPEITEDSWLLDAGYDYGGSMVPAFLVGYEYARTQTSWITAMVGVTPEQAYHIWAAIERGVGRSGGQVIDKGEH